MKRNTRKHNNYFANVETNSKIKERKKYLFNYSLLKNNQIPIAGNQCNGSFS